MNTAQFECFQTYYSRAMDMFRSRFGPEHNVIFLMASDDLRWTRRMFADHKDVEFIALGPKKLR